MANLHLKKIKVKLKICLLNNAVYQKKCFFFEKILEKTSNSVKFTKNSFYTNHLNKFLNKKEIKFPLVIKEFKDDFDSQFCLMKNKLFLSNKNLFLYKVKTKMLFVCITQNLLHIIRFFKLVKSCSMNN